MTWGPVMAGSPEEIADFQTDLYQPDEPGFGPGVFKHHIDT
jgi:hypothetical protein